MDNIGDVGVKGYPWLGVKESSVPYFFSGKQIVVRRSHKLTPTKYLRMRGGGIANNIQQKEQSLVHQGRSNATRRPTIVARLSQSLGPQGAPIAHRYMVHTKRMDGKKQKRWGLTV